MTLPDKIFYYTAGPIFTVPLPFLIAWNLPRYDHWFYQIYIGISAWQFAAYNFVYINICGYYGTHSYVSCNSKDFLGVVSILSGLRACHGLTFCLQF